MSTTFTNNLQTRSVAIGGMKVGASNPLTLICGPCQIESRDHAFEAAIAIREIAAKLCIPLIFKSSFDKANRTSVSGARGVGLAKGLDILGEIREALRVPVLTDIHTAEQCAPVAEVADCLQIPAFLCRQTDILIAAGQTGKAINVKKGQFLAPWDMRNVAKKIAATGNQNILLCERGTSFGYNTLVVDMRGLAIMAEEGYPVVFDATHSVQQPGGRGDSSGGQREFVAPLARAAVAVGVQAVFIEAHPDPDAAPSDGANMVALRDLEGLLASLSAIDNARRSSLG